MGTVILSRGLALIIPASRPGAFWRGFGYTLMFGLIIIGIIGPLAGLNREFGGQPYDGYWQIAGSIIQGRGFVFEPDGPPVLHRPPLVPLLFAPLTALPAAYQQLALLLLHSILVGGVCFFLFDLACRINGRRTAGVAVAIVLLYPWLYCHAKNPVVAIIQMFGNVFLIDMLAILLLKQEQPVRPFSTVAGRILAGVAAAALILTHGSSLPAIVLLLLLLFLAGAVTRNRDWILAAVVPAMVATVLVAPWTYRNWIVMNRFVPVVHSAGFSYFWGNIHWGFGVDRNAVAPTGNFGNVFQVANLPDGSASVRFFGVTDVAIANRLGEQMALDMKSHPIQLLAKLALNTIELFCPIIYDIYTGQPNLLAFLGESLVLSIVHLALWSLAIFGIVRTKDRSLRRTQLLVLLGIVAFCCPYLPVIACIGHAQYAAPLIPLLAVLAAIGITALQQAPRALPVIREHRNVLVESVSVDQSDAHLQKPNAHYRPKRLRAKCTADDSR